MFSILLYQPRQLLPKCVNLNTTAKWASNTHKKMYLGIHLFQVW